MLGRRSNAMTARIEKRAPAITATFVLTSAFRLNSLVTPNLASHLPNQNRRRPRLAARTIPSSCCKVVLGSNSKGKRLMPDLISDSRMSVWPFVTAAVISLVGLGDAIYLTIEDLTGQNLRCTI